MFVCNLDGKLDWSASLTLTVHHNAVKWGRAAWLAANVSSRLCLYRHPIRAEA